MDEFEVTKEKAKIIKAVDRETVHRICSGQVIINLSTAVKELVENSLDAGAKNIEIHLTDYGSQALEVSDDGAGIEPHNFQALTLKHHTSKIQAFSDLFNVATFGFRGEALSSLCALSSLSVTTRHHGEKTATTLVYDRNGIIRSEKQTARSIGTTVTLGQLFHTMPVRRTEFKKNLKRDFNKTVQLLHAYCLIAKGVRISCYNHLNDNKRLVFQTSGKDTFQDNIIDLFGQKTFSCLTNILQTNPKDDELSQYGLSSEEKALESESCHVSIEGYISTCAHGKGRNSTDKQFYYINSRPCDPSRVSRLVNEIYRQFNRHQYPFVLLNVILPKTSVDVNITPDKRQVLVESEKYLLALIKTSIRSMFENVPSTLECNKTVFDNFRSGAVKRSASSSDEDNEKFSIASLRKFAVDSQNLQSSKYKLQKLQKHDQNVQLLNSKENYNVISSPPREINVHCSSIMPSDELDFGRTLQEDNATEQNCTSVEQPRQINAEIITDLTEGRRKKPIGLSKVVSFNIDAVKRINQKQDVLEDGLRHRRFLAQISPEESSNAEKELSRHLNKDDFYGMSVLGQFNLGFIIASLKDDLFIIDQHATDEKYKFETLQNSQVMETQSMVIPQPLELTVANEAILHDNIEVFRSNGFDFNFDVIGERSRIQLKKIPHYKNWTFGKDDVDELLFLLADNPAGSSCRPSRVRAMFASRACWSSVRIGTALSRADMRRLVNHMAKMDQPWNCPHGRPTIRHLINLNMIK